MSENSNSVHIEPVKHEYYHKINKLFNDECEKINLSDKQGLRRNFFAQLPSFYRRWFYSGLIDNSTITPANLFLAGTAGSQEASANSGMTVSKLLSGKPNEPLAMQFNIHSINMQNHPIIDDLKEVVRVCMPDCRLTASGYFNGTIKRRLHSRLRQSDNAYIDYLLLVAIEIGLVIKMPSINSNAVYVSDEYKDFFELPNSSIFTAVMYAAADVLVNKLNEFMPFGDGLDGDKIVAYLVYPMPVARLYLCILGQIDGWDELCSEIVELADEATAFTYMLGVILDKYFFAPFGYYLNIINPIFKKKYNLRSGIRMMLNAKHDDEFYPPTCTHCDAYYLSPFGLSVFGLKPDKNNYFMLPDCDNPDELINSVIASIKSSNKDDKDDDSGISVDNDLDEILANHMLSRLLMLQQSSSFDNLSFNPDITETGENSAAVKFNYIIKAFVSEKPNLWIKFCIDSESTLHDLFRNISLFFGFIEDEQYLINTGAAENKFSEYVSPALNDPSNPHFKRAKKRKLTTDTTMKALGFNKGDTLTLTASNVENANIYSGTKKNTRVDISIGILGGKYIDVFSKNDFQYSKELKKLVSMNIFYLD